ncbi:PH domain-containing protein [Actinomadura barringtoniae]|uniref:PH domain-containing protein n=2 Tax=Actinomadura barringtoniae TaxID=1427535 RepID=A0A939PLW1_9ACTN|nr:PH domain-containing protein [Actinomadura barringtoniae]
MPQGPPGQTGGVPVQAPPQYPADQAFQPGGGLPWAGISKRFTWHRRLVAVLWAIPVAAIGAFLVAQSGGTIGAVLWLVAVLLSVGLAWIVAELGYRALGYAERADDLIVMNGVFVKRLIVVPYGRMQFVDVTAGLLEQWMGIATVRMHTAAAATDAVIPGLPAAQAQQLRDRLAQKGEERSMGL